MRLIYKIIIKLSILCFALFQISCEEQQSNVSIDDHLSLAKLYFKQGAFKASMIEGQNALSKAPNNTEALSTVSQVLLALNNASNAINLLKRATEIEPDNNQFKLLLSRAYLKDGNIGATKNLIDSLEEFEIKNSSDFKEIKADYFARSNNFEEAKDWYIKASKANSSNINAIIGISRMHFMLSNKNKAREYIDIALTNDPNNLDALIWSARLYMLDEEYVKAESALSLAMVEVEKYDTLTTNKYAVIDMLARSLIAQGKIQESFTYSNYLSQSNIGKLKSSYENAIKLMSSNKIEDAEAAFEDILKQAPGHKASEILLGLIRFEKGEYKEANEILNKFAGEDNSPLKTQKVIVLSKLRLNKIEEAKSLLEKLLIKNSNDGELHALLSNALIRQKKFNESINSAKKALKLEPENSEFSLILASAYMGKKDFTKAIQAAQKTLQKTPDHEKARQILISAYTFNKHPDKARQELSSWLNSSPKNLLALSLSGALYQQQNHHEKARQEFLKVLEVDPGHTFSLTNMIRYHLNDGNLDQAYRQLNNLITRKPDDVNALNLLMKVTATTRVVDKAIKILDNFNANNPLSTNAKLSLAQLYLSSNEPKKALATLESLTKIDPKNVGAYILKGRAFIQLKNKDAALNNFMLATSFTKNNPVPYTELSKYYHSLYNYQKAIKSAKQALAINDKYGLAHVLLIQAAIKSGDKELATASISELRKYEQESSLADELEGDLFLSQSKYPLAIQRYKTAWKQRQTVQLANKLKEAHISSNHSNEPLDAWSEFANNNKNNLKIQVSYSVELYNLGHFDKAKILIENKLKQYPNDISLLNNLANVYLQLDDKRALDIAKKASSLAPDNPAIKDTLGWIYSKQHHDYNKAIPLLKEAYQGFKSDEIKRHLYETLIEAGRPDEARRYL